MAIKQFFATNNARTDSGYQAFEALGRRVGGQYNQAGDDLRDIGRAKADVINMVGRWPFNIIELEQRAAKQAAAAAAPTPAVSNPLRPSYNVQVVNPGGTGITDEQFAPRVMPNLAALNEMSEGAAYLGRSLGGSQLPYLAEERRRRDDQFRREQARKIAAAQNAWQKRWDLYEKGLAEYNEGLKNRADELRKMPGTNGFSNDAQYQAQLDTINSGTGTVSDLPGFPGNSSYPKPYEPSFMESVSNWFTGTFGSDNSNLEGGYY